MKQTAVEWLEKNIWEHIEYKPILEIQIIRKKIEQAKEMEKEQMVNAFEESRLTHPMIGFKHETFKDYYSETFNINEK